MNSTTGIVPSRFPDLTADRMGPSLVVIGPHHSLPQPVVWTLREGFSEQHGETEFKDAEGNVHVKLAASLKWFNSRRTLLDARGRPVCCSYWDPLATSRAYFCESNHFTKSRQLANIRQRTPATDAHMDVFLRGNQSKNPDLEITGSFWKRSFQVQNARKELIVEISHTTVPTSSFFSDTSNAYEVKIQPGVDLAFTALMLCYIDDSMRSIMFALAAGGAAGANPF